MNARNLTLLILLLLVSQVFADEVRVVDARGNEVKRSGTITDLRGEHLLLKLASGREVKVPLARLKAYDSTWLESHTEADAKYAAKEFGDALELYRKAFNEEKRSWVKRRILERVVWCYRNTGRVGDACRMFDRLVREDSNSPYFDSIPLQWELKQCPADVNAVVGRWAGSDATPAQQLLASSWLLVQNRSRSLSTLRELGKSDSKQISSLAVAQLWRAELLTMDESRLDWREEQILATPIDLRAGQYFLLGQTQARFSRQDDAVLSFGRVPLMFPDEVVLGQRSLAKAVEIVEGQGNEQEAIVLLQKVAALDANSVEGKRAAEKLDVLIR